MNEENATWHLGWLLKRRRAAWGKNLERERGKVTGMTQGSRKGIHLLYKTKNQQLRFECTENPPYSTLKKYLKCQVGACQHRVGLPSFQEKILRALGMIGTKRALTSLVTDTDGQFCCFQSQGTCREDPGINSIILQTVFTSKAHFPSLESMPYSFLYLFIPFILSI